MYLHLLILLEAVTLGAQLRNNVDPQQMRRASTSMAVVTTTLNIKPSSPSSSLSLSSSLAGGKLMDFIEYPGGVPPLHKPNPDAMMQCSDVKPVDGISNCNAWCVQVQTNFCPRHLPRYGESWQTPYISGKEAPGGVPNGIFDCAQALICSTCMPSCIARETKEVVDCYILDTSVTTTTPVTPVTNTISSRPTTFHTETETEEFSSSATINDDITVSKTSSQAYDDTTETDEPNSSYASILMTESLTETITLTETLTETSTEIETTGYYDSTTTESGSGTRTRNHGRTTTTSSSTSTSTSTGSTTQSSSSSTSPSSSSSSPSSSSSETFTSTSTENTGPTTTFSVNPINPATAAGIAVISAAGATGCGCCAKSAGSAGATATAAATGGRVGGGNAANQTNFAVGAVGAVQDVKECVDGDEQEIILADGTTARLKVTMTKQQLEHFSNNLGNDLLDDDDDDDDDIGESYTETLGFSGDDSNSYNDGDDVVHEEVDLADDFY